jgi:RNA polymerase-interacting CarD/CdnL/TRCF family regulator
MTDIKKTFSVGDYLTDFENIYQIFDQKIKENFSGKKEDYFFYRSVKDGIQNKQVVCSSPVDSIFKSGLRHLIQKKEIDTLYKQLEEKYNDKNVTDPKLIKEVLYLNDLSKNIDLLKQLYSEKNKNPDTFSRTNKELTETILMHLSNEIAFVSKKSLDSVKTKIVSVLSKI